MKPLKLTFLGTGGGRFVMINQRRRTAGIHLQHDTTNIHLDPGPGALVFSNWAKLYPSKLDALVVTHCHPDHYNDAEVFIEAMTRGTTQKKGALAAPKSVLTGIKSIGPCISDYHQRQVQSLFEIKQGMSFRVKDLEFQVCKADHSDPETIGLKINVPKVGGVGYTSDTGYFEGIGDQYKGLRMLILCVMWPRNNPLKKHLCTDDVLTILKKAEPSCAVLTHFGTRMLNSGPEEEALYLQNETGIPVISAKDRLNLVLGKNLTIKARIKNENDKIIQV